MNTLIGIGIVAVIVIVFILVKKKKAVSKTSGSVGGSYTREDGNDREEETRDTDQ